MQTLTLTRSDFRKSGSGWSDYIGNENIADFDGNLEIEENLGKVLFPSLNVSGSVVARSGSGIRSVLGIQSGGSIKAGWGIDAGDDIQAGQSIEAGWAINAGEGIRAGQNVEAVTSIKAGAGINAGGNIKSGAGIRPGGYISSGGHISADEGIEAGLAIQCKGILRVNLRVFSGTCLWRLPSEEEKRIICSKFEGGQIAHGVLQEKG
jgi:hypothetical protein